MAIMSSTSKELDVQPTLGRAVAPWVALVAGILLSLLIFSVIRADIEREAGLRFDRYASDAKHVMEARIHSYADILYGLKGAFAANDSLDRAEFRRIFESLDLKQRFPGFEIINYAAYVPATERKHFEEKVRRDTSLEPKGYARHHCACP